ncbi:MAG: DUF3108 domain-containing protein [Bacteroidales bacterium]|nr:DUF3108 domain-containing protein [Bacteroidales bacterium]
MKRLAVILCTLLVAVLAQAQGMFNKGEELPFKAGELIRMGLYFKWGAVNTEVATGDLMLAESTLNGKDVYKASLIADSAPFFSVFYDMHERFETWFPQNAVRPLKHLRNTKQGEYRALNNYIYDWNSKVIHADINFGGRGQQLMDIPIGDTVCDISSMIYLVRTMDFDALTPGQKIPLSFAIDDTVFDIVLTYRGKEAVKVRRIGKVNALRFSCSVVSGAMFDGETEMTMWFSDDSNHVPVGFMAPLRIGSVQGWVKQLENLKYPFEARVK